MQEIVCYMFVKTLVENKLSKIIWYIALQIKKWTYEDIYIQWISNSRTTINKVDINNWKYINVSSEKVFELCEHHFISKAQSDFLKYKKETVSKMKQLFYMICNYFTESIRWSSKMLFRDFTWKTPRQLYTPLMFTTGIQMKI